MGDKDKMIFQTGDIIGYKPKATSSLLAFLIKIGARQRYSHVMIWLGDNSIVEAGSKGIAVRYWTSEYLNDEQFKVMRCNQDLTEREKLNIRQATNALIGVPYSFHGGVLLGLYKWFGNWKWFRKFFNKLKQTDEDCHINCSEFVSRVYDTALGIDLSPENHDLTSPDDVIKSKYLRRVYP